MKIVLQLGLIPGDSTQEKVMWARDAGVDGIELGAGFATGPTQFQAVLFDQRVDDLIEVRLVAAGPVPGIGTYTYENLAQARMQPETGDTAADDQHVRGKGLGHSA